MKPHLLLVTIDSLRADHLGCYGGAVATPVVDAFAGAGVRFAEHFSSMSSTLGSHASLLTGCTPAIHGVTGNGATTRRRRTLPEIAAAAGYATTAITSWGGFTKQQVYGFQSWHSQGGAAAVENRGDQTLARVRRWLTAVDASVPQILWVHFIDPHAPDNCPAPYPVTYAGEVAFVDQLLGELLAAWDAKFGAEGTVAVITADHGEHLNDHGVERGHGTLWPTTLHVPLLVRAPGWIAPGTVVAELTRQIDVLPTVLDYLALPLPYDCEGFSLRGLIEGRERDLRLVHHAQAVGDGETTAVRTAGYALHFGEAGKLAHVFDRRADGQEVQNLWRAEATIRHSVQHSIADAQDTRPK